MASFTDSFQQLTHYTPYISTNPVEAMVAVGQQIEGQYQEGLAKVNSYVSSLNGMDFDKRGAKEYVDSQLNNLKTGLSKSFAGDLSNQSLVNQIGGAARTIANDKTVEVNLMGTAMRKSQTAKMEAAQKEGKSNIANEWDYNSKVSSWINDGRLDTGFNESYVPYTDTFKKLQEISKAVGVDSKLVQQLFITDSEGNPIVTNGKLEYNDVMAESLLKGKDKNKILQAFQSGLDANDYRQLSINGRYELKDTPPEKLAETLDNSFKSFEKNTSSQILFIQNKILELKTKGGKASEQQISALEEQLLTINDNLSKRKQYTEDTKKIAYDNPDAIRASLYTNNYLDSLSEVFSEKESFTKYLKNPAVEMMLDKEKLKLQNQVEQRQLAEFRYKQGHDKTTMDFEMWKEMRKTGKNPDGSPIDPTNLRDLPIDASVNTQMADNFDAGLKEDTDAHLATSKKLAIAYFKAINTSNGKTLSDEDIEKGMEDFAKKLGVSKNDFIIRQSDKARENFYDTKNSILGNEYEEDFKNLELLNSTIGQKKQILTQEKSYVNKELSRLGINNTDEIKSKINPIKVILTSAAGKEYNKEVTLSQQDVLDLATAAYHFDYGQYPKFLDTDKVKKDAEAAKARIENKYGKNAYDNMFNTLSYDKGNFLNHKPNKEFKKALEAISSDNWKKVNNIREDFYRQSGQVNLPKAAIIPTSTGELRKSAQEKITSVLTDYSSLPGGSDYTDLIKTVSEEGSQYQVNIIPPQSKTGASAYNLQITDKKGNVTEKLITQPQYTYITGNAPLTVAENLIDNTIKVSPYNSTNLSYHYTDENAYKGAILKHTDFKNVGKYNIAMDFVKSSSGGYYPKLYYKEGEKWKMLQMYNGIPGFKGMSKEEILTLPSTLTEEILTRLIDNK